MLREPSFGTLRAKKISFWRLYFFKYALRPLIFRRILAKHCRVEEIVKISGLAWTIVRPSALTTRPPSGYLASLKLQPRTYLTARADLAAFIADELKSNQCVRKPVFIASRRAQGESIRPLATK